ERGRPISRFGGAADVRVNVEEIQFRIRVAAVPRIRALIEDDDLEVLARLLRETVEQARKVLGPVVGRDDDAEPRSGRPETRAPAREQATEVARDALPGVPLLDQPSSRRAE